MYKSRQPLYSHCNFINDTEKEKKDAGNEGETKEGRRGGSGDVSHQVPWASRIYITRPTYEDT